MDHPKVPEPTFLYFGFIAISQIILNKNFENSVKWEK